MKSSILILLFVALIAHMAASYSILQTTDFGTNGDTNLCQTANGDAAIVTNTTLPTCQSNPTNGTYMKMDCTGGQVVWYNCSDNACSQNCVNGTNPVAVDTCSNGYMYHCYDLQDTGRQVRHEVWSNGNNQNCSGDPTTSELLSLPACTPPSDSSGSGSATKSDCQNGYYLVWDCSDSACQNCSSNNLTSSTPANGTCSTSNSNNNNGDMETWTCIVQNSNSSNSTNNSPSSTNQPPTQSPASKTPNPSPQGTNPNPNSNASPVPAPSPAKFPNNPVHTAGATSPSFASVAIALAAASAFLALFRL